MKPIVLALMALTLTAAWRQSPVSVGLIQATHRTQGVEESIPLAVWTLEPRHYKLIHGEEWIAVGLLHPGVNRIGLPIERFTRGGDRFHMVLVTKNGPTVTARDLLLHIRVSGGDDANGGDGADSRDAEKISPHFTERLASAFDMDEREKRRRRIMGNGSYGPMDPATGRYQWLDSVNLLGVASAIAKSLKKRKSGAENTGPPTMVRRITITYSQTTPDEGSRIRSAEVRLDVTPPRPFDH